MFGPITVLFVILTLLWLCYMYNRQAYVLVLFIVFLFSSIWRLIGTVIIDFYGPFYSDELFKYIGGSNGFYTLISFLLFFIVLCAILWRFGKREKRILEEALNTPPYIVKIKGILLECWLLWLLIALYAAVLIETVKIGEFPLISGLERWRYFREFAGPLTKYVFSTIISTTAFLHGYLYVFFKFKYPNKFYLRLVWVAIILQQVIFFAQGNKFTTPFFTLLFTLSVASIAFLRKERRSFLSLFKPLMVVLIVGVVFSSALYRVYMVNRGYSFSYLKYFLFHRLFIAPNQLNYDAADRVFFKKDEHKLEAIDKVLINKLPMDANPSVNYLMYKSRGPEVLNIQCGFTDAYPGILIEMFGRFWVFAVVLLGAIFYVWSGYKMISYVALGHLFYAIFFFFIFYAFSMLYYQGQFPTLRLFIKLLLVIIAYSIVKKYRVRRR